MPRVSYVTLSPDKRSTPVSAPGKRGRAPGKAKEGKKQKASSVVDLTDDHDVQLVDVRFKPTFSTTSIIESRKNLSRQVISSRKDRDTQFIRSSIERQYNETPGDTRNSGLLNSLLAPFFNRPASQEDSRLFCKNTLNEKTAISSDIIDLTGDNYYSQATQKNIFSAKCSICQEEQMKDPSTILCYHVFCHGCISAALSSCQKCPICRKRATTGQIKRLYF